MVYEGHDQQTNRNVAIKIEPIPDNPQGQIEAHISGRKEHPNIVAVYNQFKVPMHSATGELKDQQATVMEKLAPESFLNKYIQRGETIPNEGIKALVTQTASALDYLHNKEKGQSKESVIHRDLKPGNISLTPLDIGDGKIDWQVKIIDFGISNKSHPFHAIQIGHPGHAVASLIYSSPEALMKMPEGPESDVYSLGAILYEALLHEPHIPLTDKSGNPFDKRDIMVYRISQKQLPQEKIDKLEKEAEKRGFKDPTGFANALAKSLTKETYKRHKTPGEFAQAINKTI